MNKILRYSFVALLAMIVGNIYADSYKLEKVTSVTDGGLYVFEQGGHVMGSTIASSALQTVTDYKTTGLEGTEAYVWKLESTTGGFYMKNNSLSSNEYLKNASGTAVSFVASDATPSVWAFNFQDDETVLIQNTNNGNRYLGYTNATSYAYKAYATSSMTYSHAVVVYQLVNTSDTRTATTINFSEGYKTKIAGGPDGMFPEVGYSVALPTATVMANGAAVAGATAKWSLEVISWKEGKPAPTIADGKISFENGCRGEISVKASFAGNESYKESSKSYSLKVYNAYGLLSKMADDIADPNCEKDDPDDDWGSGGGSFTFYFFRNIDAAGYPVVTNTVTYVNGKYIYLTDGKANLLFYGNNTQNLKKGDVISGNVSNTNLGGFWGTLKRYKKLPEFAFTDMNVKVESSGATVTPTTITIDKLAANLNNYVKVVNAEFVSASDKNLNFKVGETTLAVYNQFGVSVTDLKATAKYTIEGMGSVNKKDKNPSTEVVYQLYPITFTKTSEPSGINTIKTDADVNAPVYNLAGQKVDNSYKGVVIMNGKKFVNK